MTPDTLAPETTMAAVTLKVGDLDRMLAFYRDGLGLDVLGLEGGRAVLGHGAEATLVLEVAPELRHAPSGAAGLFHTAFLFAEKGALAAAVYSLARKYPQRFTGSSDHFVSNAFYFDDPEGNGVELYWDTDRALWEWRDGTVRMGTVYLDPNRFLQENLGDDALGAPVRPDLGIGHVHLKVGDIPTAKQFYVDTLGFEITLQLGGQALFVSAGGYHHHVGMNTWQSAGAGTRTPALGLGRVDIRVPGTEDLGALRERLRARGVQQADDGHTLSFDDPWANRVSVTSAA